MTLKSELAAWKQKKAEEQRAFDSFTGPVIDKPAIGSRIQIAQDNIERIEQILIDRPWQDDMEAENMRHYQAVQSISARYPPKGY